MLTTITSLGNRIRWTVDNYSNCKLCRLSRFSCRRIHASSSLMVTNNRCKEDQAPKMHKKSQTRTDLSPHLHLKIISKTVLETMVLEEAASELLTTLKMAITALNTT